MIYFIIKTSHLVNANADCAKVYCKNVEDLIKSSSFFKLKRLKSPKFSSRTELSVCFVLGSSFYTVYYWKIS